MTERLSQLLHDEADRLDVPPVTVDTARARGRGMRRRRTAARVGAAAAALVVVGGVALVASGGNGDRAVEPAGTAAESISFAIGNQVYVDGGTERVTIDDKAVKSLYYTSAGLLVRHGNNPDSDGGGPQRFSLVQDDGTVRPISVETEETLHSTDPAQPYLAYADTTRGSTDVVVWDLESDSEAARVALPAGLKWGGWDAPPVSLSGDLVYVGADDVARVVNWRTGEITQTETIPPGYPGVFGGRTAVSRPEGASVIDAGSGRTMLQAEAEGTSLEKGDRLVTKDGDRVDVEDGDDYTVGGFAAFTLSPDGRYAMLWTDGDDGSFEVYQVDSGKHVSIDGSAHDYGWSADGQLFRINGRQLTTCSPSSGECETTRLDIERGPGELVLGGRVYES